MSFLAGAAAFLATVFSTLARAFTAAFFFIALAGVVLAGAFLTDFAAGLATLAATDFGAVVFFEVALLELAGFLAVVRGGIAVTP